MAVMERDEPTPSVILSRMANVMNTHPYGMSTRNLLHTCKLRHLPLSNTSTIALVPHVRITKPHCYCKHYV